MLSEESRSCFQQTNQSSFSKQCTSSMNKNEIVEPHTRPQNMSLPFPKPFTAEWTLRRIRRDLEPHALRALQSITHSEKSQEATLEMLQIIKELED